MAMSGRSFTMLTTFDSRQSATNWQARAKIWSSFNFLVLICMQSAPPAMHLAVRVRISAGRSEVMTM